MMSFKVCATNNRKAENWAQLWVLITESEALQEHWQMVAIAEA